ncbi:MAG: flagellar type III secretion system pore protein FliP [Silvanigrellales bacterium]|jgi:flagellar biosynthetic protein FliP|nr:flagellar type III secretion system pore protein FliP [Silvanigrellales bacterium]
MFKRLCVVLVLLFAIPSLAFGQSEPSKPALPAGGANARVMGETASGVPYMALPAKGPGPSSSPLFSLNIANSEDPDDLVPALRVVAILTILTFAPAILLLMSSFTRILIVLSFLRQALGAPTMPPNQVLVGLSLFLTYFVMAPTTNKIYDEALKPYMDKTIPAAVAFERGTAPVRNFMLSQARKEDLALFFQLSKEPQPKTVAEVPMRVLIPAFVIGELKAAFQIGFLVYLPFIIIDMIVSSVLMAMGMMMLPPTVVSLPLKIILFVLVDGWNLLAGSLVRSFA